METYERLSLKKYQSYLELLLLILLGYYFFPTTGNFFSIIFKFGLWLLLIYFFMYWINLTLTKVRLHIESNYLKWLRRYYEDMINLKLGAYSNNLISKIIIFFINIALSRKKALTIIKYYLIYERLIFFTMLSFITFFGGVIYVLLF